MSKVELTYQGQSNFTLKIDGEEIKSVRSFSYHARVDALPVLTLEINGSHDDEINIETDDTEVETGSVRQPERS